MDGGGEPRAEEGAALVRITSGEDDPDPEGGDPRGIAANRRLATIC